MRCHFNHLPIHTYIPVCVRVYATAYVTLAPVTLSTLGRALAALVTLQFGFKMSSALSAPVNFVILLRDAGNER